MATVTIYRDIPIIANKMRPYGSMVNSSGDPLTGRIDVDNFISLNPASVVTSLTLSPRKGKVLQNSFVRSEWSTAF